MAKYLVAVTETYRVDTEEETTKLIEEAKDNNTYILSKYSSVHKERKQKGEIIDEYERVTLVKIFNDEKEPYSNVMVNYGVEF